MAQDSGTKDPAVDTSKSKRRQRLRRLFRVLGGILVCLAVTFVVYFPGRQTPIAFTLATGIGIRHLQDRVDMLEEKAIRKEVFTEEDRTFARNLYTCFAKGAGITVVLRQSGDMMRRYLSRTGQDLKTTPRIFVKSRPVQRQIDLLKERILKDLQGSGRATGCYSSEVFYMGDPEFFDSFVGLYFGRITAAPGTPGHGKVKIHWRAECPWEWPSYDSLFKKYGRHHAQCFSLPNARSILFGSRYCLRIDDGLGGHLVPLGIAKSFLVYSEWTDDITLETR